MRVGRSTIGPVYRLIYFVGALNLPVLFFVSCVGGWVSGEVVIEPLYIGIRILFYVVFLSSALQYAAEHRGVFVTAFNRMKVRYSHQGRRQLLSATVPEQPESVEDKLTQLKALLDKGFITEEEYQEKRAKIVSSL